MSHRPTWSRIEPPHRPDLTRWSQRIATDGAILSVARTTSPLGQIDPAKLRIKTGTRKPIMPYAQEPVGYQLLQVGCDGPYCEVVAPDEHTCASSDKNRLPSISPHRS